EDCGAGVAKHRGGEALHGPLRADRHKDGRGYETMRRAKLAGAGGGVGMQEREADGGHTEGIRPRHHTVTAAITSRGDVAPLSSFARPSSRSVGVPSSRMRRTS